MNKRIRELVFLALSTSILVVQELVFSFLPNIQLTTFLILIYTKVFGIKKTSIIVLVYVFIDNLLFGSITMINIVIPMLIAWMLIVIIFYFISKYTDKILIYVITAYVFGHIYGLIFTPFQAMLLEVDIKTYMIADIPWQIIMGLSNAFTVLWLFEPLEKYLIKLNKQFS